MDNMIQDLISLAEGMIKKLKFILSVAEILPSSKFTEFEDGTNFPYKFATISRKMRRGLNKMYIENLKEEIEEWNKELVKMKKTRESIKKRIMEDEEGESSNKKIKGNEE